MSHVFPEEPIISFKIAEITDQIGAFIALVRRKRNLGLPAKQSYRSKISIMKKMFRIMQIMTIRAQII